MEKQLPNVLVVDDDEAILNKNYQVIKVKEGGGSAPGKRER